MLVGRRIWLRIALPAQHGVPAFFERDPVHVMRIKQFLPAGRTKDGKERKRSLLQLWCDPGGMRTVAVAEIWGKNPNQNVNPW